MLIKQREFMIQEIEAARKRLLDLTARNRLLNYRPSKIKTIEFEDCAMQTLFKTLVEEEKKMSFRSKGKVRIDKDSSETDDMLIDLFASDDAEDTRADGSSIYVNINKEDVQSKLHKVSKLADSFFEEQGYSVLFVALGFINWKDPKSKLDSQRAPLILIPVELHRTTIGKPYRLQWTQDEIISNVCMIEKAKEFDVTIPLYESHNDTMSIKEYIKKVEVSINKKDWTVEDRCCLDFFSFTKFVLWKDLDIQSWDVGNGPLENDLIRTLLLPPDDTQSDFSDLEDYNQELKTLDVYHILDADPSQIAVIEAVKKGTNIIVEGPPGTGKSQTIANIIAELLGQGKSVLFVSEKMAALQVVKSRLDLSGLGDFCMELHSRKTNKREFISSIANTFQYPSNANPAIDLDAFSSLENQREQLNLYAKTLATKVGARDLTIFALMSLREVVYRHFDNEDRIYKSLIVPSALEMTSNLWNQILSDLSNVSQYAKRIPSFKDNPWVKTDPSFFLNDEIEEFKKDLFYALTSWTALNDLLNLLQSKYGVVKQELISDLHKSVHAASLVMDMRYVGRNVVYNSLWETQKQDPCSITRHLRKYLAVRSLLLIDHPLTTEEVDDRWGKSWTCLTGTRKIILELNTLKGLTGTIYNGIIAQTNDFLETCKVVADTPCLDKKSLLDPKWKDISIPTNLVALLSDTQNQYILSVKNFIPEFLAQDHISTIEFFNTLKIRRMRFVSARYRKAKQILKRNLIDKTFWATDGFNFCLEITLKYFKMARELQESRDLGLNLFGNHWHGLKSNVKQLQCIIEWHSDFERLNNKGFFSEDSYAKISNGSKSKEIHCGVNTFIELMSTIDPLTPKMMSLMNHQHEGHLTFKDLLSASLVQLKYCRIIKADTIARSLYGYLWNSINSQVDELVSFAIWRIKFIDAVNVRLLNAKAVELLDSPIIANLEINEHNKQLIKHSEFVQLSRKILKSLGFTQDVTDGVFSCPISLHIDNLKRWKDGIPSLIAWIDYVRAKKKCKHKICFIFTEALEECTIEDADDVVPVFKSSYAETLLKEAIRNHDELINFSGVIHEKRIEVFCRLDKKVIELNRLRLVSKLNINRPKLVANATDHSEVGFLRGEINKKRAQKPIRQILSRAGNLIIRAKPCFLMSPLSIAQYLDPQSIRFDTIIFDEASQVRPEDALGSLMRGRQLVVMGDSRQLPPTMFFDHMMDDDMDTVDNDNYPDSVVDTESILQQSRKKLPLKYLKWHYRSKHESLIQVSNSFFYNNRLQVFPSALTKDPDIGLQFHHVPDTIYDRGKGSVNRLEAKCVVDLACKHYLENPDLSLGIGAFSVKQQDAILNELELVLRINPSLQPHFAKDKPEHFFVKNLETIQGDEREVIIVSIGYGFDQNHQLHMNFGPLNQEGGDRRLNVLITRARKKCIVVSNFKWSDMKVLESSPQGLRALHAYLHYAEMGEMPIVNHMQDTESPFEDSVYDFLIDSGYNVVKQVGCASFRIDMAITHPENTSYYVLGIECDGAMYHSSRTARERDRLRQEILENLGWSIYRIWSTDWYRNRQKCKEQLVQGVEIALRKLPKPKQTRIDSKIHASYENNGAKHDMRPETTVTTSGSSDEHIMKLSEYVFCEVINLDQSYELHEMPQRLLLQAVLDIVQIESPIHKDDIITRIRTLAGYDKAGSRIRHAITRAMKSAIQGEFVDGQDDFLWKGRETKITPRFRRSTIDVYKICDEEFAAVIHIVLNNQLGTERHELCLQVSRLLGIQRLTIDIEDRINTVINSMIKSKKITQNGDDYIYPLNNKHID